MFDTQCVRRQQSEEGEKNGSEDDEEEKPGKRVMGPRKKFVWDDRLRSVSQRKICKNMCNNHQFAFCF